MLPPGLPRQVKESVRVHPTVGRGELIAAMRASRVMLYLGHKCEALPVARRSSGLGRAGGDRADRRAARACDRRRNRFSPFHPEAFAGAAVSLLTDDSLWRRQHEAALRHQQGITWSDYAARFEHALLGDEMQLTSPQMQPLG